ncbi:hypothetical protein F4809DRAFT_664916 [Biscogniauxia mediterranea]|nr:hypothetical protein F4809DRAFT_664916 [Biscogniauxia mediterranea]
MENNRNQRKTRRPTDNDERALRARVHDREATNSNLGLDMSNQHQGEIRTQASGNDLTTFRQTDSQPHSAPALAPIIGSSRQTSFYPAPGPNTPSDAHLEYIKVSTRNAKCDQCEKRNTTIMQKCMKCGMTTCEFCHRQGRYDGRHNLAHMALDWTIETRGRGSRSKKVREEWNPGNDGGEGSNSHKRTVRLGRPPTQPDQIGTRRGLVREPVFHQTDQLSLMQAGASAQPSSNDAQVLTNEARPGNYQGSTSSGGASEGKFISDFRAYVFPGRLTS